MERRDSEVCDLLVFPPIPHLVRSLGEDVFPRMTEVRREDEGNTQEITDFRVQVPDPVPKERD